MTGPGRIDTSSPTSILNFLESDKLEVEVSWGGEKTVTNGTRTVGLKILAEEVNTVYANTISKTSSDFFLRRAPKLTSEQEKNDKEQLHYHSQMKDALESRIEIFEHFNRVIELYEDSEKSRWLIGRIIYRIIRVFNDWNLHTVLGKSRQNLKAASKFEESFRSKLLPIKYKDAKEVRSKDKKYFIIPREDFSSIMEAHLKTESSQVDLLKRLDRLQTQNGEIISNTSSEYREIFQQLQDLRGAHNELEAQHSQTLKEMATLQEMLQRVVPLKDHQRIIAKFQNEINNLSELNQALSAKNSGGKNRIVEGVVREVQRFRADNEKASKILEKIRNNPETLETLGLEEADFNLSEVSEAR